MSVPCQAGSWNKWVISNVNLSNVHPLRLSFYLKKKNAYISKLRELSWIDQKMNQSEPILSNIIRTTVRGRSSLAYQRGIVSGDGSCALHTHHSACLPGHTVSELSTYKASLFSYTSPTSCVLQDASRTSGRHTPACIVYVAWHYLIICA